ncbi:MAG: M48 family metalloprotease, partial [Gammaproteobacteria bacterium]|nr:M48 family metalloprotease [Gammaproteobacteria bacterium]
MPQHRVASWFALILAPILVLGLATLPGCATNPVTGSRDFVLMSEQQEIALGRQYHPQVLKETPAYTNAELAAYVQRIGAALAAHSHRTDLIYRFTVLDSQDVNAFALPGGYIYITRGLLAYLNSEAELAAVLGHEIGHVTARHSVRQQSAATATGLFGAVLAGATGVRAAGDLANVAGTALVRGYGREHELEADRLGAEYLARSGYDPQAMLRVIHVLKDQESFEIQRAKEEGREPRVYHGLFSTHPDNDQRLQEVVGAARKFARPNATANHTQAFLKQLEGLTFGDSERDGIRRGNRFYHGELDFALEFPESWRIENSAERLLARSRDGNGLMQFTMQDRGKNVSPQAFLREQLHLNNVRNGESIQHAGLQGYTALVDQKTSFGRLPVRYAVLYRGTQALIFAGLSKAENQPYKYDSQILQTVRSFHPLTEQERNLARAQRLHILRATATTRFASLARESALPDYPEARLRLLNGHYPSGE